MKRKIILSLLALFFVPSAVFAHVKWFAEPEIAMPAYSLTDWPVMLAIVLALLMVGIGVFLEKRLEVPQGLNKYVERWAAGALSVASIGFGLAFIIFSINGFFFAPNLVMSGVMGEVMFYLQLLAGVMIFLGLYERLGGLLIVVLFALGVAEYGLVEMLDTLEMLGFAFYAMIIGRPKWRIAEISLLKRFTHRIHEYGLPILRVGTGLNLVVLGFTEKILAPSLTNDFLAQYNWNFMELLGFDYFTDYWFAFYAGVAEVLFGVFFLLGLVTRTTTVALAVFLVTTLVLLGPIELVGHLPHFSIAIVLLVLGSGSRLVLIKNN